MRILVTGGAGFIGSHVVNAALIAGHEVAVLDNFSSGTRTNALDVARVFEVDLRNRDRAFGALGALSPSHVSHHAAWIDAPGSLRNPRDHFENNVMGSINLIDACVAVGVDRIAFASSGGAIYGETPRTATEGTLPRPENPYGAGKLAVEHLLAMRKEFFSSVSLRYPNVYGPRQRGGVVGIFVRAALRGEELRVFGDRGGGERTYAFVKDVARDNVKALEGDSSSPVNIPGYRLSTLLLAEKIVQMTGSSSVITRHPARDGDISQSRIDSDVFYAEYSGARTSIEDGLAETIEWWRAQP